MSKLSDDMPNQQKQEADAELEELDVREVSIVDRPANKRRFLIVKRAGAQEGEMDQTVEVLKDEDSLLELLGLGTQDAGDPSITEPEEDPESVTIETFDIEAITKAAVEECSKVINAMVGRLSKVISSLKGAGGEDKETDKAEIPAKVAAEIKSIAKTLGTLADKLGGKADAQEGDKEAEKAEVPDALKVCSSALQRLMATSSKLKSVSKGTEEVPTAIVSDIGSVAVSLGKLVAESPAPGAEGDKEAAKEPVKAPAKGDPTELRDKEKATKQDAPLQVFVAQGDDSTDPEIVIKAGAKMKRSRLNQFKKAVETLMSLLKELEGDQNNAKDKKGVKKSEEETTLNEKLAKGFEALESKLADKIKEAVEPVTKRLDELDATVPPSNGDTDATETKPEEVKKSGSGFWGNIFQ